MQDNRNNLKVREGFPSSAEEEKEEDEEEKEEDAVWFSIPRQSLIAFHQL